ncbi:PadR family transcriptional regulator [Actinocatenispora thailandica]|uniref:PadR family transcriptional regulator n=2 Tax=Actinocatenispora thailandica TaxID=227318 RepID=A0A7R7DS14_9ACTN|nr:PadR family transcriptional regulator [Actinocatenispora thailandica]
MAILGLLEDEPLHPYRMQQLLKEWGKDQVVNVGQRATLYKLIKRLDEEGLIRARETARDHRYPERTVYELTDTGRDIRQRWLTEALSTARDEFPEFPAALSFLPLLAPETVRELLTRRREQLVGRLAARDALVDGVGFELPRVSVLETGYQHAIVEAEIRWLDGVLRELADGSLTWHQPELDDAATRLHTGA